MKYKSLGLQRDLGWRGGHTFIPEHKEYPVITNAIPAHPSQRPSEAGMIPLLLAGDSDRLASERIRVGWEREGGRAGQGGVGSGC